MNCLMGPSRKNLDTDRYSKSSPNLQETLIAELQTRLKPPEVKSCENLTVSSVPKLKESIGKSRSFRLEKPTRKVKKSDSFFMLSPRGNSTIFGSNLSSNVMATNHKNVPKFVVECCTRIVQKLGTGDEVRGVYRVPGELSKIKKIGRKIMKGEFEYLDSIGCVNDLAGSVKFFLRETKTPLVSSEEIQTFQGLDRHKWYTSSTEEKCKALKMFVRNLDPVRKNTLEYVLKHLKTLCTMHPDKLNSKNFAISIGPAIIHINSKACLNVADTLTEHDILNEYLQFMIDYCIDIYRESPGGDEDDGEELILETCL